MNERMMELVRGVGPLVLLAILAFLLTTTPLLEFMRTVPPAEELSFERVVLAPGEITLSIANGGPDPVTVAQVTVDDAFWDFDISPDATIPRLGRATVTIPYPWVQEEAHEVVLLTSTGLTFPHEIEVAVVTPPVGPVFWGVFGAIGLFVGVIPVAIGLLWLPFLRGFSQRWTHFALALAGGLLIFLGVDAFEEALETAGDVAGSYQGTLLVLIGTVGTLLILQVVSARSSGDDAQGHWLVAFLVAIGVGLHNLGEGLAIGASYALGEASLGAFLIVGFMLHNTTEGLAIVAPVARDNPSLKKLFGLGLIAGVPTIFGAWIGGLAYSPIWATLFLSAGVGAIIQVVLVLYRMVARQSEVVWTPLTASGFMTGLLLMYGTGLLVAI